jgi:hypothetical protein
MPNSRQVYLAPRLAPDGVHDHHPARGVAVPKRLYGAGPPGQRFHRGNQGCEITWRLRPSSHPVTEMLVSLLDQILTVIEP